MNGSYISAVCSAGLALAGGIALGWSLPWMVASTTTAGAITYASSHFFNRPDRQAPTAIEKISISSPSQDPVKGGYSLPKVALKVAILVLAVLLAAPIAGLAYIALKILERVKAAPQKAIDVLSAFVHEYGTFWKVAAVYFQNDCSKLDVKGKGEPILLVHGYLHNASGWRWAIEELKKLGRPIYTINLGDESLRDCPQTLSPSSSGPFRNLSLDASAPMAPSAYATSTSSEISSKNPAKSDELIVHGQSLIDRNFWSIESYARQVREKVEEIKRETGQEKIALVGHSMGGVVSACYATQLATPGSVSKVITLGSPLKGARNWASHLVEGPNGSEMKPSSPFLKALEKEIDAHPEIPFFAVGSTADELVSAESALSHVSDSSRQIKVENMGHMQLMVSQKVSDIVYHWLKN